MLPPQVSFAPSKLQHKFRSLLPQHFLSLFPLLFIPSVSLLAHLRGQQIRPGRDPQKRFNHLHTKWVKEAR